MKQLKNSTILITGGTGSFGSAFIPLTLKKYKPKKLIIFSRDELKQWELSQKIKSKNVEFILGDIRNKESILDATKNVDYVVHAAAIKIVTTSETNPYECIKTNVIGSMNVLEACKKNKVKKVIALSTDKASNPINLYGATKLASDKLFVAGNNFNQKGSTKFSLVRYGNVAGSRGSIIPFFKDQFKTKGVIPITNKNMTRFLITLRECVEFVWFCFNEMKGGEIFIKKLPSFTVLELAKAISSNNKFKIIGIRPGEKMHEQMISSDDSLYTYDFKNHFKILPTINNNKQFYKIKKNHNHVAEDFSYVSNKNSKWLKSLEIRKWIKNNPRYL
mgnify:CR=1 FL=1|tara:strand:- start:285 stop:1280 length:996 start_codon:yes stop_codon:yes gene_type:complete